MNITSLRHHLSVRWQRTLYIMFFAQMMTAVGFSSISPFLPLYVKDLGSVTGMSIELLAGLVYSAQAFTMMLASPIWGSLADRHGRKMMVERSLFGGAIILFVIAFSRSAEELIILRAIQGLITGTVAASSALIASIVPRDRMGYAMGLSFALKGVAASVLGGMGNTLGSIVGGLILGVLEVFATAYISSGYKDAIAMMVLILLLIFRPQGLLGGRVVVSE